MPLHWVWAIAIASLVSPILAAVSLQDGVPQRSAVNQGKYSQFLFTLPSTPAAILTVVVTPFGDGDPDLYVSTSAEYPTQQSYTAKAQDFGEDSITLYDVAATDVKIAVYGWRNTSFTIVATVEHGNNFSHIHL